MRTRPHLRLASAVRWYRCYRGYKGYRYNSHAVITHHPATGLTLPFVLPVPPVPLVTPVPQLVGGSPGSRRQLASTSPFVLPVPPVPPVTSLSGRNDPWA
jgi:hypothetical protein